MTFHGSRFGTYFDCSARHDVVKIGREPAPAALFQLQESQKARRRRSMMTPSALSGASGNDCRNR
jgi:hypothetical protein